MNTPWSGSAVRRARAEWARRLPAPCCRCGRPVIPDPTLPADGWQVDHYPIPREAGGTQTAPAHARCNMSAGGRRGAQIRNQRRATLTARPMEREQTRGIRGI